MQSEVNRQDLPRHLIEFINANLSNIEIFALPTDLSKRKYYRIIHRMKRYVLMDSNKEPIQFEKFLKSTKFLAKSGFSVPYIYLIDFENSVLLIEDFGNNKVSHYLNNVSLQKEQEVYKKSLYLISKLHKVKIEDFDCEIHNYNILNNGISEFVNNCVLELYKDDVEKSFRLLFQLLPKPKFLSLRDFHVDNLMWLKDRDGINKVGLIDYQDLSIGYKAYDIVSLLQDARRFITPIFEQQMLEFFFHHNPEIDQKSFMQEYIILSLQRNLRVFGLFMKSSQQSELSRYKKYLPNVRNYIERNIDKINLSLKVKKIIIHSL